MPRLIVLLLAAGLLFFAACEDNGNGGEPTGTDARPAATEAAPSAMQTASSPTVAAPFEGGRDPIEVAGGSAPPVAELVDVRTGRHEDFDRVVFEFTGALPGYRVEYVAPPIIACGSGMTVAVDGGALLLVEMNPAAAHNDAGETTFGPQELLPGLASILEVTTTCDFEGFATWVVGLTEEADFNVFTLDDPFRVVVDVAHP